MRAEIIASGTEILLGEITDTNTQFIASQLAALGVDLYYVCIVGDNYERFLGVLKQAYQRSDIVFITGGLGPTKGDITREVIAGLMEEKMQIDPVLKQHISDYFSRLHLEMPENNLKQATLIPSACSLPNPLGSAPGWWVEKGGKIIVSLPGPPGEMQPMWQSEVAPRLEKKRGSIILSRTLKTWGLSEAKIDQMVGHFMSLPNPTLALYAKPDGIQLRITAKAPDQEQARILINGRENDLRALLQDHIWGADKDTLEDIISRLLLNKSLSLAVAESVTGGLLAYSISGMPGSSRFFKGGLVVMDNKTRAGLKIIPEKVEDADTRSAACLAEIARTQFGADIGIGIDGYVSTESGVATGKAFISINLRLGENNVTQTYPAGSYQLVRRSTVHALFCLRKLLLELG